MELRGRKDRRGPAAGGRPGRRRSGATGRRVPAPAAALVLVFLGVALLPGRGAGASLSLRPVIDGTNAVLGAGLFAGSGPLGFFGDGGFGLSSGRFHGRAGVTAGALRQTLTLSYLDWPGSPVQGRAGQTGTSLRWTLHPDPGVTLDLAGFAGTLWPVPGEAAPPGAWVVSAEASYRFSLGAGWRFHPRLTSVWGELAGGEAFTSHLAVVATRLGWTRLQAAAGWLRSGEVPGFAWSLGGGGRVPLRGYPSRYATGDRLVGLSLEHRLPLPVRIPLAGLQAALFVDAGDVLAPSEAWSRLRLSAGYGTGLVLATALGELHADLAWNPTGALVPAVWLSAPF